VLGSVLLGRLQGEAAPADSRDVHQHPAAALRLSNVSAKELVEQTQRELVELLSHEQASLAVAQRCSRIVGSAPLFSTLLNYRHGAGSGSGVGENGRSALPRRQERTNYPITMSVDDSVRGLR